MIELELIERGEVVKPELGPWRATESQPGIWHIDTAGSTSGDVATVWGVNDDPKAAALLIAAAPDMMAALRYIDSEMVTDCEFKRCAQAAIRKATCHD